MAVFKDDLGRMWEVLISVKSMYKLKLNSATYTDMDGETVFPEPLDLANMSQNNALAMITDMYPRMIAVYLLCKRQADLLGISDKDFLDACVSEEALTGLTVALFTAIEDSFPNVKVRGLARKIRETETVNAKAVTSVVEKFLEQPEIAKDAPSDEEIESLTTTAVEEAMSKMRGQSSGDVPQP